MLPSSIKDQIDIHGTHALAKALEKKALCRDILEADALDCKDLDASDSCNDSTCSLIQAPLTRQRTAILGGGDLATPEAASLRQLADAPGCLQL